jgi:hypothetical protein
MVSLVGLFSDKEITTKFALEFWTFIGNFSDADDFLLTTWVELTFCGTSTPLNICFFICKANNSLSRV